MNEEKRYKVSVKTPNRFLSIRGKLVRTPTDFISTEKELKTLKTKFQSDGITKFSVEEYKDTPKIVETFIPGKQENPKTEVEITINKEDKKESTLNKILNS